MPSKSETKRISHDRIRSCASKALRREGLATMSLHDVMRDAGLTVGGFYAHYGSRGEMVEDAFNAAVDERREAVKELLEGKSEGDRLSTFIASYLSDEHVDKPGTGCPWAASLSDLQRSSGSLKKIATDRFERAVSGLHPDRRAAIATLTLAFSSLILMRTVTDEALRNEIAEAAQFAVATMIKEAAGRVPAQCASAPPEDGAQSAAKGDLK